MERKKNILLIDHIAEINVHITELSKTMKQLLKTVNEFKEAAIAADKAQKEMQTNADDQEKHTVQEEVDDTQRHRRKAVKKESVQ